MSFEKVDRAFYGWAKSSELIVQTENKGEEVRSADIFDNEKQKLQLWLVPVDSK
jgi:hypothetical protein